MDATGRKQFSYGSISGRQDFYFVAGKQDCEPMKVFRLYPSKGRSFLQYALPYSRVWS
jgi:hypothetical protein